MSDGQYYSDGNVRVTAEDLEGGYKRVTFDRRPSGLAEETCDRCPCLDACLVKRECVKGTAFVTERLR